MPLIRTVADRTVRSVRTSLPAGSDKNMSAGARVQNGFPTGDRPPTLYVVVRVQRDTCRPLRVGGQAVMGSGIWPVTT